MFNLFLFWAVFFTATVWPLTMWAVFTDERRVPLTLICISLTVVLISGSLAAVAQS